MSYVKLSNILYYGIHPSLVEPNIHIDYIIDLTEDNEYLNLKYKNNKDININYLNFPIKDRTSSNIKNVTNIINKIIDLEGVVYICCKGGHGRSGMIACCVYGLINKLEPDIALQTIYNEWNKQRDMNYISPKIKKLGSPQTKLQKNMVHKFLNL